MDRKSLLDYPEVSPALREIIENGRDEWGDNTPRFLAKNDADYDRLVEAQMLGEYMSGLGAERALMTSDMGDGTKPSFLETCMRTQLEILVDGYQHQRDEPGVTLSLRNGCFAEETEFLQRQAVMTEMSGAAKLTPEFREAMSAPYVGYVTMAEHAGSVEAELKKRYSDFGKDPEMKNDDDLAHHNLCIQMAMRERHAPMEGREEFFDCAIPVPEQVFATPADKLLEQREQERQQAKPEPKPARSARRLPDVTMPEETGREQSFEEYMGLGG